ncbi:MAG: hypothetical protein H6739_21820 [Alphaproteobacteria bacterium]|nr:hypothetical protein [Alphaproteobacteria bacterium]
MSRLARRIEIMKQTRTEGFFNPEQHVLEAALRGRSARKIRAHLRRMDPVVLTTPRWSKPQVFLEDLALDLAVGEPGVGCRTVSFRPLKGRPRTEAWFFVLQVLAQLSETRRDALRVPTVASSKGFRTAARSLLERAQFQPGVGQVALLAHGAEYLPVDVIEDLAEVWARFAGCYVGERRATMLMAGTVDAPQMKIDDAPKVVLADYGEAEAAAALVGQAGPSGRQELERAARFSGGIPAVVEALGSGARASGGLPDARKDLIRCMGQLADEIRGAVHIVSSDSALADRMEQLLRGEPLVEIPTLDRTLMLAGLLKTVRLPGEDRVLLRGPAIGAVLA